MEVERRMSEEVAIPCVPIDDTPVEGERVTVLLQLLAPSSRDVSPSTSLVSPQHGRGPYLASVERRTEDTVLLRQTAPRSRHTRLSSDDGEDDGNDSAPPTAWFQFDHVTEAVAPADAEERGVPRFGRELERVAAVMPYALGGLLSNTNTSILWLNTPPSPSHDRGSGSCGRPLFDRVSLSQSVGIRFLDDLVAELRKQPTHALRAYLSVMVWNHRDHIAVDLFGHVAAATTVPEPTPFAPSGSDGTLFPTAYEVCVCGGPNHVAQRPSDVVPQALRNLVSWETNASVPLHATVFATVTLVRTLKLPNAALAAVKTRLCVLDVHYLAQVELLCRVGRRSAAAGVTPWLQKPTDVGVQEPHPLPLLFFGLAMENRCVVTAAIPTAQELPADAELTRDRRAAGSPALALHIPATLDALASLRLVVTGARGALEQLPLPPIDPEALGNYRLMAEVLRLRHAANCAARLPELLGRAANAAHHRRTDASPPAPLRRSPTPSVPSISSQRHCVEALESAAAAASASWGFAAERVALLDEVRADLAKQRDALEQRRSWLMALPVTTGATTATATAAAAAAAGGESASGGASMLSLSERARLELLERTVALLEDENARLRRVFARDVSILRLDLAAAKGLAPMVSGAVDDLDGEDVHQSSLDGARQPPRRHSAVSRLLASLHRGCVRFLLDAEQAALRPRRTRAHSGGDGGTGTKPLVDEDAKRQGGDEADDDTFATAANDVSREIALLAEELRETIVQDTQIFEATAGSGAYQARTRGGASESLQRSRTNNDDSDEDDAMPTEGVVDMVLQALALGCGVDLPPPTTLDANTATASSASWWRRAVKDRASAAVERYRLRHCADCLVMYTERLVDTLSHLATDLMEAGADSAATHSEPDDQRNEPGPLDRSTNAATGVLAQGKRGASAAVLHPTVLPRQKPSSLLREVEALITAEATRGDHGGIHPRIVRVHEPKLLLAVERCRSIAQALSDVARGVCHAPSSLRRVDPQPLSSLVETIEEDRQPLKHSVMRKLSMAIDAHLDVTHDDIGGGARDAAKPPEWAVPEVGISLDKLLRGRHAVLYRTDDGLRSGAAPPSLVGANAMRGSTKKGYFSTVSKMSSPPAGTKTPR